MVFGTKTVDSVLKNFTKTVEDLKQVFHAHIKRQVEYQDEAAEYTRMADDAKKEAERAGNIITKLEALLSGD